MNTSFVKLPQCGAKACFLLTQLKDEGKEGFELTLTDGDKFWEGQITEEDLDAHCSNLKMDFTTYVKKAVAAFTRRNMGGMNFEYQMKTQADGVVDFLWKEEVDDIKILMGSATLHQQKGATKALMALFASCIDMAAHLQHRIDTLQADNQRLAQERQNALTRLDKCVNAKEELEKDLYSKFVAVLNSKKEKIRNLQDGGDDTVESVTDDPLPSTSGEVANGKRGRAKTSASNKTPSQDPSAPADDAEEGEDRDTDEETPPTKRRAPVRKGAMVDADSSLNLGDDDGDDKGREKGKAVVRRPARQRGNNKRQTPSKPVLPKVSSRSSDLGAKTPQRGSLRKSGSGNSDRSVDKFDTDDLLNDF
ncbi:uncharacterized protein LOC143301382 [Babylonia areolata]|uniref:uncharacterized protein LOC143301382 n=1 Tax=Babylonia areolata TaxID=304850 RepID=UPI003FD3576A